MNSLSRTFVKLLSSPSTRNRVLLPLLTTLNQSSSSSSSSSLFCHFTAAASAQKYPSRKYKAAQQSSSLLSASVIEPSAEDHPRDRGAPSGDWPRPSEIPWQAKVCNSVNLIGKVHAPVQFQQSSDGKCWAVTVIAQDADAASHSPALWIPLTFEGDLAYIAACHLKENDCVYIAGQLITDPPPLDLNQGPSSFQVMVHTVNFVMESGQKKSFAHQNEEKPASKHSALKKGGDSGLSLWRDLIMNPKQWRDNRQDKLNGSVKPKFPDFKRKDDGVPLWLDSAPEWVSSKLEGLEFDNQTHKTKYLKRNTGDESWKNLVENPDKWWDNRSSKTKEKAPDFKHKDTGEALWLSSSPAWVLSKLPPIKAGKNVTFTKRETLLS